MASITSHILFRENVSHDKIPTPTCVDSKRLQRNEFYVFCFSFQISYPYYTLHHHTLTHIYSYGAMYTNHHPTDNQIRAIFSNNPDYYCYCLVD